MGSVISVAEVTEVAEVTVGSVTSATEVTEPTEFSNFADALSTLHRALERLGLTRKKLRRTAIQRDELTRTQWIHDITSRFTADQLVFADESSKDDRTCQRLYGRAPSGRRACEARTFARGVRYSILPALSLEGILTVRVVRGSVDGLEFYDWVVSDLVSLFFVCFSSESLPFPSESLPFPTQTC